jgi:hypothetical protein
MKKLYPAFLITILLASPALNGQLSMKQAGIRSGYRSGIFIQTTCEYGNAETGFNAMISFNRGIQLTGLRVIYETALEEISPDLFLAWGYGGHVGFSFIDHYSYFGERYVSYNERFCPAFGADGWIAAEYRFREIPINVSLNLKPFVELTIPSFVRIIPWDLGFSISYVF